MSKTITNNTNIPMPLAVWLASDEYLYSEDPNLVSATTLLKPIKSLVLGRLSSEQATIDISEVIASRLGTAIHSSVEKAWLNTNLVDVLTSMGYPSKLIQKIKVNPISITEDDIPIYLEKRVNKKIDGFTISGQFDIAIDGHLYDVKSTGTFGYMNQSNATKYIQQASIYRWLNPDIITDNIFSILYVFTDWSSVKAKQETNYPKSRLLEQKFSLMSLQETENFIKNKLALVKRYTTNPHELPDCTDEDLWVKPSIFSYYKNRDKLDRSTKNFDTFWEANQRFIEDGSIGIIKERKGEAVFCKYCSVRNTCKQAANLIQEGRLIL